MDKVQPSVGNPGAKLVMLYQKPKNCTALYRKWIEGLKDLKLVENNILDCLYGHSWKILSAFTVDLLVIILFVKIAILIIYKQLNFRMFKGGGICILENN